DSRAVADAYIDSVFDRIRIKTGEQSDLLGFVATGRVGDAAITTTDDLAPSLARLADEGVGPAVVKGDITVSLRDGNGSVFFRAKDRALDSMFDVLMSRPTNYLS